MQKGAGKGIQSCTYMFHTMTLFVVRPGEGPVQYSDQQGTILPSLPIKKLCSSMNPIASGRLGSTRFEAAPVVVDGIMSPLRPGKGYVQYSDQQGTTLQYEDDKCLAPLVASYLDFSAGSTRRGSLTSAIRRWSQWSQWSQWYTGARGEARSTYRFHTPETWYKQ